MTTEEKIDKMYDVVIRMEPMVKAHGKTLYGNGKLGLEKDFLVLKENYNGCPARKAVSSRNKRLNIATTMMIVAIIGLLASTAMGILNYLK